MTDAEKIVAVEAWIESEYARIDDKMEWLWDEMAESHALGESDNYGKIASDKYNIYMDDFNSLMDLKRILGHYDK